MDLAHSPRHTRRGFLRGDSAPKFFHVSLEAPALVSPSDLRPPGSSGVAYDFRTAAVSPPPGLHRPLVDASYQPAFPESSLPAASIAGQLLPSSNGNAFLSWLADQLTGQANSAGLTHRLKVSRLPISGSLGSSVVPDWSVEADELYESDSFDSASEVAIGMADAEQQLVNQKQSLGAGHATKAQVQFSRYVLQPAIQVGPDGGRMEIFAAGGRLIKDVLGRVVEVHSQYGDRLYFRYGSQGHLQFFERRDRSGNIHSSGQRDKHGVVVQDQQGRVRAAGECMTVDPRGCFYLHSQDGQFFSLDLVSGTHSERRRLVADGAGVKFITSLFAHDGFRMATMFGADNQQVGTTCGESVGLRFYGRDGTLVEFASEDDLRCLHPSNVLPPASGKVMQSWLGRRQAGTAWDSVHEYLMRVS